MNTLTYTGGVSLEVLLPSGALVVQPGEDIDVDELDAEALDAHPDFSPKTAAKSRRTKETMTDDTA